MALVHDEEGAALVVEAIAAGAAMSVANWAEVLSNVAADGDDPREVASRLGEAAVGKAASIWVDAITAADCVAIGEMRPATKPQGISLADRACLVLAARLGVPALTSDQKWAEVDVEAEVVLIR